MNLLASSTSRNWGTRVRDYQVHDLRLIVVENDLLRVGILAGKGTDIVELLYKPIDLDFVWLTPRGVQNPFTVPYFAPIGNHDFLDTYPGGWQEIFPNGGARCHHGGATFSTHGEVHALPWEVSMLEDSETSVAVRFSVRTRRVPCLMEKTLFMEPGLAGFRIEERLTNESPVPLQVMWGHHITFGPPFLGPGCRLDLPDHMTAIPHAEPIVNGRRRYDGTSPFAWPTAHHEDGDMIDFSILPDRGEASDQCYLHGFKGADGWYKIMDEEYQFGARIAWDAEVMPYLWYWQEFGANVGFPSYGRNYNIGLEPFSSYPNSGLADAVANGSALKLNPGEQRQFWLTMSVVDPVRA